MDDNALIPRSWGCVSFSDNRNFTAGTAGPQGKKLPWAVQVAFSDCRGRQERTGDNRSRRHRAESLLLKVETGSRQQPQEHSRTQKPKKASKQIPESQRGMQTCCHCDLSSREVNLEIWPSELWSNKPMGFTVFVVTCWSRTENYYVMGFSRQHRSDQGWGTRELGRYPRPMLFTQAPVLMCSCSS